MKPKNLLVAFAIISLFIGLYSCKKNKDQEASAEYETTYQLSNDQATAENLTEDANSILQEVAAEQNLMGDNFAGTTITSNNFLDCAEVTVTPVSGFPKTIVIDFGIGCTSPNGITRKGKMTIVLSDSVRKHGSTAVMTFDHYFVNNYQKEGTITWTNTSTPGTKSWQRKVENGKITAPDGRYWLHSGIKDVVQTAGINTPYNLLDDVFSITGNHTVTNAAGKTRECTILEALQKKVVCANIDKGKQKIQGPDHYAIIDFGDGTCDRTATISIDGNPPRTILLPY